LDILGQNHFKTGGKMKKVVLSNLFAAHVHLRRDLMLADVISFSEPYKFITAMGNTSPLITDAEMALSYEKEIKKYNLGFEPIMTIMLTAETTAETIRLAYQAGIRVIKYIPEGTSTGAVKGIKLYNLLRDKSDVLEEMEMLGMIFSGHWELIAEPATGHKIPFWLREERALPYFKDVVKAFPKLKIIFEHASTANAIRLIQSLPENVAATLTIHHAIHSIEEVFNDHDEIINPFLFCLPCLKSKNNVEAVKETMLSGNPRFFFGPDCAPHYEKKKRNADPPTGICTPAIVAIPLLVKIFNDGGWLEGIHNFTSKYAMDFYGLTPPKKRKKIVVIKKDWTVAESYNGIVPLMAGQTLEWQIDGEVIDLTH